MNNIIFPVFFLISLNTIADCPDESMNNSREIQSLEFSYRQEEMEFQKIIQEQEEMEREFKIRNQTQKIFDEIE